MSALRRLLAGRHTAWVTFAAVLAAVGLTAVAASSDVVGDNSYAAERGWELVSLQDGVAAETNAVSIQSSVEPGEDPAPGDIISFTAEISISSGCDVCQVVEARWYVDGERVQTTSLNGAGSARSTFAMEYQRPTSVYCEFSGMHLAVSEGDAAIGYFEHRTSILSYGREQKAAAAGSAWAWDRVVDGETAQFTVPASGRYTLILTAADGSTMEKTLDLAQGDVLDVSMSEGGVSFGDVTLELERGASLVVDPTVELRLESYGAAFTNQPEESTAIQAGDTVTLTVETQSNGMPVSYQWYCKSDGSEEPEAVWGATEAEYSFVAGLEQSGYTYYCIVTCGNNQVVSSETRLDVCLPPTSPPVLVVNGQPCEELLSDVYLTESPTYIVSPGAGEWLGAGTQKLRVSLDGGVTWDTDITAGRTYTYNAELEGELRIIAESYNSIMPELCQRTEATLLLDTKAPVVEVSGLLDGWVQQAQELQITKIEESGLGLDAAPFSWDGGQTWSANTSYTVAENQTVRLRVRDLGGNVRALDIEVSNFDMAAPTVTVTGNTSGWKSETTLRLETEDDASGVAKVGYSWDGGQTWTENAELIVTEDTVVQVQVRDEAGHSSEVQTVVVAGIDTVPPTGRVEGNPTTWQNTPATLSSVSASDDKSGLHAEPYSWDGGQTWTAADTYAVSGCGDYTVCIRDLAGNVLERVVAVRYVDTTAPDITLKGLPDSWTNLDVLLQAGGSSDGESGLAALAYNWNNKGWSAESTYVATGNGTVTLAIRDALGNTAEQVFEIDKIDKTAPVVTAVTGLPTEWQDQPATITVAAEDIGSGLATAAYSFDDGVSWQLTGSLVVYESRAVGLKVRDKAGNTTYYPIMVNYVDAVGPELTVRYTSPSDDLSTVIVSLSAVDGVSDAIQYCFGYDPSLPILGVWSTVNEREYPVGVPVTVAARDEMGNVTYETVVPTVDGLTVAGMSPLFTNVHLPVSGFSFGPADAAGEGVYLDSAGTKHSYQVYQVNGRSLYGLKVELEALPISGGYLAGTAKLNGNEYPIYWDAACTETVSATGGTGAFYIDAQTFRSSAKNGILQVVLQEYETDNVYSGTALHTDSISASVMVDITPPSVTMELDEGTRKLSVLAVDALSGIASLKYRVTDSKGEGVWNDYLGTPIELTSSGKVEVLAVDRLGNVSLTDSKHLSVASSFTEDNDIYEDSFYYRSSLFEHYLFGTGKTSIQKPSN